MNRQDTTLLEPGRRRFLFAGLALLFPLTASAKRRWPEGTLFSGAGVKEQSSTEKRREIVLQSLMLLGTDYRFGGKHPNGGIDCSGMVSYIYEQAAGLKVKGNAASIATQGVPIKRDRLQPGDLVFFNTRNRPFSHVGIYIGDNQFVHAPATNKEVRVDKLSNRFYAKRYQAARAYID